MPSLFKSLFLVVATSTAMAAAARDVRADREPRGFVRKARNLSSKSKGKDAKEAELLPTVETLPPVAPLAAAEPVPAVGTVPPVATEVLPVAGTETPSPKGSKKGGTYTSTGTEFAYAYTEGTKSTKASKKGSTDIPPPPPPPPTGFRIEVPLSEIFIDERLGNVTLDIFGNETFANETFANETFAPTDFFANETFTNETLPPTELFTNETLPPTEFTNETDPFLSSNETSFAPAVNETVPPVPVARLKLVGDDSACMAYNQSLEALNCDVAGELADWEVLESTDPALFQLRHVESQLCLPENPESPETPFTCWITETDKAIGDTINGLVNCSSPFAAFVGFIDPANPSFLYNAICSTGDVGAPSDVVLMAYTVDGATQFLWGEKILLDVPQMTVNATYSLSGSFFFAEA